jgi:multicomponent Na+:H+ antiporter subunit G
VTGWEIARLALAALLLTGGTFFMLAAAIGARRLPDSLSRLHAVTKAETAGLALFIAGTVLTDPGWRLALVGAGAWLALALSGAAAGHFIAARETGRE